MPIEKHMLQTHSLFEKAGEVFEGVAKLKERITELETRISSIHSEKMQLEDDNALLRQNNAELRKENAELRSKNEGLLYALADAETDLDMATRWRKCSEELPSEEGYYLICGSSGFRTADKWTYCKDRQKMDFSFYSYGVKYWMPLPSAPKEGE